MKAKIQFYVSSSPAEIKKPAHPKMYKQFSALSTRSENPTPEGIQEIEIETKHLFDDQFNTADGRRLFDWYVPLRIVAKGTAPAGWGHYLLPESLDALNALRAKRHICGFCGYQTDTPEKTGYWCDQCLGSQYLEAKDLYLLQLVPVINKWGKRDKDNIPADLIARYEAVKADYASKQGERLIAEREKFIVSQANEHKKIDRKTEVYLAVYDAGIDPSKTGAVYYDHTDTVSFGAIKDLTPEQIEDITIKATAGKIPCKWEIKARR